MTCKCHSAWGKRGKKEKRWFVLTMVCVVLIGTIGLIVITGCEDWWNCRRLYPDPLRDTSNKILYPDQSEDSIPGLDARTGYMALPLSPHCGHLYNHPGKHKLWAECMGVGYDDTKIDHALYADREGRPPDCTKIVSGGRIHEWRAHCMAAGDDKKEGAYR